MTGSGAPDISPNTDIKNILEMLSLINERSIENDKIIAEMTNFIKDANSELNKLANLSIPTTPLI